MNFPRIHFRNFVGDLNFLKFFRRDILRIQRFEKIKKQEKFNPLKLL